MANGVNKVFLLGNLGMDPELRATNSGEAVMRLRLATSKSWLDKTTKQKQERVEWHTVIVWGNRATALAKILTKGMRIHIEGELRTREYELEGVKRWSTEVTAFEIALCEKAPSNRPPVPDDDDRPEYGGRGGDDIPF